MKTHFARIKSLLIILSFVVTFIGCIPTPPTPHNNWVSTHDEFDSLISVAQEQFTRFAPLDSITMTIEEMDSLSTADSLNSNLKLSRTLYWKARCLERTGQHDSCLKIIKEALLLNDSLKYPYDHFRMKSFMYVVNDSINIKTKYEYLMDCIGHAVSLNDKPSEAFLALNLGNTLNRIGEYSKALCFYQHSDSLSRMLGHNKVVIKNKVNKATLYENMGNKSVSDSILLSLLQEPIIMEDHPMASIVNGNLYFSNRDSVKYLHTAYNIVKDTKYMYIRGVYSSCLILHSLNKGFIDSARYYAHISKHDLPYVSEYEHKALIWHNLSQLYRDSRQLDSALMARDMYEMFLDSMYHQQCATEVIRLSLKQELALREAKYETSISKRNVFIISVIVGFILLGIIVGMAFNRYKLTQKMKIMEKTYELEKTRKKIAATTLNIEEKDKILGTVKSSLSEMREEKEIDLNNVKLLEATIKSHLMDHDSDEAFQQMFDVVNPGFKERLKKVCPNLAESYIKLACYTLMDLDNKKIARLMMIKPESVHQARWRLRQKLNIPENESINDFLNRLNAIKPT